MDSLFPIFYLLNEKGELSVTEIANEIEITHSAISQMVTILEKKKMIKFIEDKNDKRKRLICFTKNGHDLMDTISPVWDALHISMSNLFLEGENSTYILSALNEIEESLNRKNLHLRVTKEIEKNELGKVEIIPFDVFYKLSYKNLILNWIVENQNTGIVNTDLINFPERLKDHSGNEILLAIIKELCVGTIVSKNINRKEAEVFYFVVDEKWKQRQIGRQLLKTLVCKLKENQINKVSVKFGRKNSYAIRIFKDEGFSLRSVIPSESESNNTTLLMDLELAN